MMLSDGRVRATAPRRSRAVWVLVLVGGFVALAFVIRPFGTFARNDDASSIPPALASPAGATPLSGTAKSHHAVSPERHERDTLLGTLMGAEYIVSIFATKDGPRYTVRSRNGRLLQSDLPADEVYRAFPTLDIENMRFDPPATVDGSLTGGLMLAEPRE